MSDVEIRATLRDPIYPPGMTRSRFVQLTLLTPRNLLDGQRDIEARVVTNDDPEPLAEEMYLALQVLVAQQDATLTEPLVRIENGCPCGHEYTVVVTAGIIR